MKRAGCSGLAFSTVLVLVVAMLAVVWPSASPAQAAGALLCNGSTIYGVVPDNPVVLNTITSVVSIDGTSVGGAQLSGTLQSRSPADTQYQNGLGILSGGASAFTAADRGATVRRYDSASETWSSFPGRPLVDPADYIVTGAVDPSTGIYYFGDVGGTPSNPTVGQLFGFDTTTNRLISPTPLITFPAITGEVNGDVAFDGAGNLYIVTSSSTIGDLQSIPAPLPSTAAQARQIVPTSLSTFAVSAAGGASVNGIAFDSAGTMYLSLSGAAGGVFSIDPGTGSPQSALTPLSAALIGPSGTGLVDLASCAFPPSVSVQKNVISRVNPTDQFTLQATGPNIIRPSTATTVGTATGLQATAGGEVLQAGPAPARFNSTYTGTETAAGTTDLSQYISTYSCVDTVHPTNPEFPITGTGTTVSFNLDPFNGESPSVVCTFTNAPTAPALDLAKTANPTTITQAGQAVAYTFTLTNTGNTTLTGAAVTEQSFSGTGVLPTPVCAATTLVPGESTTCTADYTATAADITAGSITNTAVATGQDPTGATVSSPPSSAVVIAENAALDLTKTANPITVNAPGDTITYTFHVTNTGNVPVTGVTIEEGSFSGTGSISAISCAASTLAPGTATDCTATYQATQADIDAGPITNDATATGDDPGGDPVTSPTADAIVTAPATPALSLTKTVSPTSATTAGQTVTYSFLITNTGNVTITNPAVVEGTFTGTGTSPVITCPPGTTTLAPGDSLICTAPYTLAQADADTGHIDNTATATGDDPGNTTVTSNEADVTLPIPPTPALTLTTTANPTTITNTGDTITYTFTLTNTGNTTLTSAAVTEQSFSGTGTLPAPVCAATTLAPSESTTCTADYTATAADITAGSITNTAVATAIDPAGNTVSAAEARATVEVAPAVVPVPPADDAPLADTGSTIPGWLAPLAGLLAIAGIGLTVMTARTRNKKNAK
jgi:uncharacterized repeat protein (TIGR01451 family)